MNLPGAASKAAELAKSFFTLEQKIDRLEEDFRDLRTEISGLRADHVEVKMRVAVLEEARKNIDLQVELQITKTVSELRLRYAEASAQVRANPNQPLPPALPDSNQDPSHRP